MSVVPPPIVMLTLAKSLLPAQYTNKANWDKLCAVIARPFQDLETEFQKLLLMRYVSVAAGDALDQLGAIVKEGRKGRLDAAYRIRIKAKILLIKSSGTQPQILALLTSVFARAYLYTPYYPASFEVETGGATTAIEGAELGELVQAAKAAGVKGEFVWSQSADASSFIFSDDTEDTSATQGMADDDEDGVVGGVIADSAG